MRAAIYRAFGGPIQIETVADPELKDDGVIIQVEANGLCRSDWHGWQGHDGDIVLPHVPGHELAGTIVEAGKLVRNWQRGDRVTVPFCGGCGYCLQCQTGNQQVCDNYFQPGFTAWGSFAEWVLIRYADQNLVRVPEDMSSVVAAVLGCRFMTAYRGIVAQGQLRPGQWLAVFGCGGVGLSAIMIAHAMGSQVIAVDINQTQLSLAKQLGAKVIINAGEAVDLPGTIKDITKGGVHVAIDALGSTETCVSAILSLRKRGKHIQIGLMAGPHQYPPIPMAPVIANELEIIGSHGMQAHQYPSMFQFILQHKLPIEKMIGQRIGLAEVPVALSRMNDFERTGIVVMDHL